MILYDSADSVYDVEETKAAPKKMGLILNIDRNFWRNGMIERPPARKSHYREPQRLRETARI